MLTRLRTPCCTWRAAAALAIAILGAVSTIGSGSSGSGGGAAPLATITFPPPISSTDASALAVTGTATDETGVALVEVNGIGVTSTSGNFATWRVIVPLVDGANTLTVAATDTLGISDAMAATATVNVAADVSGAGATFMNGYDLALDATRAWVTDFNADELVQIDLATGSSSIVSRSGDPGDPMAMPPIPAIPEIGAGTAFDGVGGIVLINGLTAGLVTNWQPDELLTVDLVSGNRTILSDTSATSCPDLFGPMGIAMINDSLAVVTNSASDEVLELMLPGGSCTLLSSLGIRGTGPGLTQPEGVAIDSANDRALVTDSLDNTLYAVNLSTGDRTIISRAGDPGDPMAVPPIPAIPAIGAGVPFDFPIGITVDSANNRALVANNNTNQLLAVDLATGDRTVFSDSASSDGTGPVLSLPSGIALDGADTAYVTGLKIWAVELVSGDRVIVGQ